MENVADGKLLRIFVGKDDEHDGQPLFEAIVRLLRREGLAEPPSSATSWASALPA